MRLRRRVSSNVQKFSTIRYDHWKVGEKNSEEEGATFFLKFPYEIPVPALILILALSLPLSLILW